MNHLMSYYYCIIVYCSHIRSQDRLEMSRVELSLKFDKQGGKFNLRGGRLFETQEYV